MGIVLWILVVWAATSAWASSPDPNSSAEAPKREVMSQGPVDVVLTADPGCVRLDRDVLLTIRVAAPESFEIKTPALLDRLKGFTLNGAFDKPPVTQDGKTTREYCYRLTPTLAEEYRVAPLPILWSDKLKGNDAWLATRALLFTVKPIQAGNPGAGITGIKGPVWIYPTLQSVLFWLALGLVAVAAGAGLVWLIRRLRRQIRLRRMSPRERAMFELTELMEKDLISQHLLKIFYVELTLIVRRYIERAHAIKAPEQTTEEFLLAVSRDPRFSRDVVQKLRTFLQTADLVKFAAYEPDAETVDRSLSTAQDYIKTDERQAQRAEGPGTRATSGGANQR